MSIEACLDEAVKNGEIDRRDAADLIDRYKKMVRDNAGEGSEASAKAKAQEQLATQLAFEAAERRRRAALTVQAQDAIKADLMSYRSLVRKVADVAAAAMNIIENYGTAGFGSVKGRYEALMAMAKSGMDKFIWEFRRTSALGVRMNPAELADVVRAAFGESVSPQAQALYRSWLKQAEKLRQLFNAAGGSIGWKDGWGLPQLHNGAAILNAKFEKWRDYISPRLDWDKMTHPDGTPILESERNTALKYVYDSITMDGWNSNKPSMRGAGRALASTRQDSRFLIFKDASSWMEYNRAFGTGETYATMMGHIHSMARDVSMMERLGPNPAAMMEWMKQVVSLEANKFKNGQASLWKAPLATDSFFEKLRDPRLDVDSELAGVTRILDGYYNQMRGGVTAGDNWKSLLGTTLRNEQYGAKLGGSVILHAMTNPFFQAYARFASGVPVFRMLPNFFKSFGSATRQELARATLMLDDAMSNAISGAKETNWMNRMAGASRVLPDRTTAWTGLTSLVENFKRVYQGDFMGFVGEQIEKSWQELPQRIRRTMTGYGIDARDWRVMQMADIYQPAQGAYKDATWLRPQEIRDVGTGERAEELAPLFGLTDEADPAKIAVAVARATESTAMKYMEMIQQETLRAVPSDTWRSRAFLHGRTDPGTYAGLFVRSASMFHGFIASVMYTMGTAMMREIGESKGVGAASAGALFFALTLGGMASLQIKNMLAGKDLRSMDPTSKEGLTTWAHAMLTGGSFGILGDFLASDRTSYGHGPLETLAGPIVGMAADGWEAAQAMAGKVAGGKDPELGRAITNLVRWNTPFFSTAWPLRAAYQRVAMDQLQFLLDPKAHQKMREQEVRLRQQTGQGMWWRPGELMPDRPPIGAQ